MRLALQHQLVTKFTSLIAVDENISRNPNDPIFNNQIAQNIPEGWVDPEIMKQANAIQNLLTEPSHKVSNLKMEPIELEKVNFLPNFGWAEIEKMFYGAKL